MNLSTREGRKEQGARIKRAARDCGMTLDDIARAIGASRALIYQYSSGISLAQPDKLQQIANLVNRPLEWFFAEIGGEAEATRETAGQSELRSEPPPGDASTARGSATLVYDLTEEARALADLMEAWSSQPNWARVAEVSRRLISTREQLGDRRGCAEAQMRCGYALIQLQEWSKAREELELARATFRELDLKPRSLACLQNIGHIYMAQGRIEAALRSFEEVSAGADQDLRWQSLISVGAAHETLGKFQSAMESFDAAMDAAAGLYKDDAAIASIFVNANRANVCMAWGDYKEAEQLASQCLNQSQAHGLQDQYIEALLTMGSNATQMGDLNVAQDRLLLALEAARLLNDPQRMAIATAFLSEFEAASGRPVLAVQLGKGALAQALRSGAKRAEVLAQRALATAYLTAGNAPEAEYHSRQAMGAAEQSSMKLLEGEAAALLAYGALIASWPQEALVLARQALDRAAALGTAPLLVRCHITVGLAALAVGDAALALEQSAAALEQAELIIPKPSAWRAQALRARALYMTEPNEMALAATIQAVELLQLEREALRRRTGEENLLDTHEARDVCQLWLTQIAATNGSDQAVRAAASLEWPPMDEWLANLLSRQEGSTENA